MKSKKEENKIVYLQNKALNLRIDSIRATTASASGHPTTCLSAADLVSVLFFDTMKFDIKDHANKNNDRFILSKGHGIPVVYAAYKQLGVISDDQLMRLRDFNSPLEGHPTPRFIYNEAATGSLGQGLAIGCGMALSAKQDELSYKTYVMMGDGEITEGSIWEAAELASHYKLDNLVGIVDCNRLAQSGTSLEGHDVDVYAKRFEAFGWRTFVIDGHNVEQILETFEEINTVKYQPSMIIAKTLKGYGTSVADKNGFHGVPFKADDAKKAIEELKENFKDAYAFDPNPNIALLGVDIEDGKKEKPKAISLDITTDPNTKQFDKDQSIATRKAYGYALAALGRANKDVMGIDADVGNSTFTQIFEKEFPERTVQCFIAEQTMVGIAAGLETRGKIPFAATFGAFFTRAHDQIRMAGIGKNALRLCGSHCGVSIGEDGPSQMGLEDLAMMRCIPNSVVLYPSDGVSTYKLVEKMANYRDGVSYIRTTRGATPNVYDKTETFELGGCKVLRQSANDVACLVAAGITLHEALKAYEELKKNNIFVSVIDAYSVKPLDVKTIKAIALKSGKRVITVEDHYEQGGLGEAVAAALINDGINVEIMAVQEISRSGKPEELLRLAGIDADAIVVRVRK